MTAHEAGARDALGKWLRDPEWALVAAECISDYAQGRFAGSELEQVMGTGWRAGVLPPEQMLLTMLTHIDICAGNILRTAVRAAGMPDGDREREANAAALAELPGPFTAHVDLDQHAGDTDGWLEWHEPIRSCVCVSETAPGEDGRPENVQAHTTLLPMRVPLEIGSTLPSRTRQHLAEEGGVARWPYGSDWVYIYVAPDHLGHMDRWESVTPYPRPAGRRVIPQMRARLAS